MSVKYHGVVVPESTDLADGPKAFRDLTDFGNAMPIFATLAERDAWASPPDGALCTVLKSSGVAANQVMQWTTGSGWKTLETPLIGEISMWATAVAPTNYLLCNGQAVPAGSDYDQLRAVVGANVPDLRDRFVVGAGGAYAAKATGGEATHVLTAAEMPAHNHTGTTGGASTNHSHGVAIQTGGQSATHTHEQMVVAGNGAQGSARVDYAGDTGTANILPQGSTGNVHTGAASADHSHGVNGNTGGVSADHTHGFTTSTQGGGAAFENRPPYYALTFIIRAR